MNWRCARGNHSRLLLIVSPHSRMIGSIPLYSSLASEDKSSLKLQADLDRGCRKSAGREETIWSCSLGRRHRWPGTLFPAFPAASPEWRVPAVVIPAYPAGRLGERRLLPHMDTRRQDK